MAENLANILISTRESDAIILNRLKFLEVQMAATYTSDELLQMEGKSTVSLLVSLCKEDDLPAFITV